MIDFINFFDMWSVTYIQVRYIIYDKFIIYFIEKEENYYEWKVGFFKGNDGYR